MVPTVPGDTVVHHSPTLTLPHSTDESSENFWRWQFSGPGCKEQLGSPTPPTPHLQCDLPIHHQDSTGRSWLIKISISLTIVCWYSVCLFPPGVATALHLPPSHPVAFLLRSSYTHSMDIYLHAPPWPLWQSLPATHTSCTILTWCWVLTSKWHHSYTFSPYCSHSHTL